MSGADSHDIIGKYSAGRDGWPGPCRGSPLRHPIEMEGSLMTSFYPRGSCPGRHRDGLSRRRQLAREDHLSRISQECGFCSPFCHLWELMTSCGPPLPGRNWRQEGYGRVQVCIRAGCGVGGCTGRGCGMCVGYIWGRERVSTHVRLDVTQERGVRKPNTTFSFLWPLREPVSRSPGLLDKGCGGNMAGKGA